MHDGAEAGNGYIQFRERETTMFTANQHANLRIICRRAVTDHGPHQSFHNETLWLPWAPFALLYTVNFLD